MKRGSKKPDTSIRSQTRRRDRLSRLVCAAAMLAALLIAVCAVDAYRCANEFVVTEYRFETPKVQGQINIVMVSDLHESQFGENNERLIESIRGLEPDLILCAGDMITRTVSDEDLHIGLDFMEQMTLIAPTYMSLGNHENEYVLDHDDSVLGEFSDRGVRLLELEYEDVTLPGGSVRIGGISDYCFNYGQTREEYEASEKYAFFNDFCDTAEYKILLSHRPTAYRLNSELKHFEDWDLDLVLAGHTHGGLWHLPLIGSPYLPQQGFLPELDHGLKQVGRAQMIIGAGLGSENGLFRLNNPTELVVIRLVPEG